jgi:hypothetical protein
MMIFDIVEKKKEVMCKRFEKKKKKKSSRNESMKSYFLKMKNRWKNKLNTQIIEKKIRFFFLKHSVSNKMNEII